MTYKYHLRIDSDQKQNNEIDNQSWSFQFDYWFNLKNCYTTRDCTGKSHSKCKLPFTMQHHI